MRVRLNEGRVAEMLRGMDPAALGDSFVSVTAGLLHCIGDVAALNFVPVFTGELPRASLRGARHAVTTGRQPDRVRASMSPTANSMLLGTRA